MITAVPLPRWRDLLAMFTEASNPVDMAKPWLVRPDDRPLWFARSSWSLAALAEAFRRRYGRAPLVSVPDYFCNASLEPLRLTGSEIVFHPIGDDLNPVWSECAAMAAARRPDLFVLVHYFGSPADAAAAKAFCTGIGAVLVEDCAHCLAPAPGIGATGDFVLWSPHKSLPAPHGALLVCRGAPALSADDVRTPSGNTPTLGRWLVKRLVQKIVPGWLLPPATQSGPRHFADDPAPARASLPVTPAPSLGGLTLVQRGAKRLAEAGAARRINGVAVLGRCLATPQWTTLFDPADRTPYRLVMRCATTALASERFELLRGAGLPVESWPDLPPEVKGEPQRHATALQLRTTLLCLPVHQDLKAEELLASWPAELS